MLTDSDSNAVVAIYETHPEAEAAVQALQRASKPAELNDHVLEAAGQTAAS
jgi:hypothetical protein